MIPTVLSTAPVLWSAPAPLGPASPSCGLSCYQPVAQCQTFWCWAAVLHELRRCLSKVDIAQCALAERYLAGMRGLCCPCDPTVENPGNLLGRLTDYFTDVNPPFSSPLQCQWVPIAGLSQSMLQQALCNRQPVAALFKGQGTSPHYAVISGITPGTPDYSIEICDPDGGKQVTVVVKPGQSIELPKHGALFEVYILQESET